jgi:predicted metalloprotease with PDZ domain
LHYGARAQGIDTGAIRSVAEAIAGRSLASYFRRFIDGNVELPVPELLRLAGVKVHVDTPAAHERNDKVKAKRLLAWSGLSFATNGEREAAVVRNVVPDSPAWHAGITFGDEIVAVDGARVGGASVTKRLADGSPGQNIAITFFRKDRLHTANLRLARNPERKWIFAAEAEGSPQTRRLRARWLGTTD